MSEHKRFSPSSLYRVLNCTASLLFIESLPPSKVDRSDSIYARRGTAGHTVSEMVLNNSSYESGRLKEAAPLEIFEGQEIDDIIIDTEIIAACRPYTRYCQKQLKIAKFARAENKLDLAVWKALQKTMINGDELGGTMDYISIYDHKEHVVLEVTDLKTGSGNAVEVKDNPQLLAYALCALIKYYKKYRPTRVKITIVQQPVDHPDGPIRSWVRTPKQVLHWGVHTLIPLLEEALEGGQFAPAEETCKWCPGRASCAARYKHACDTALAEFDDVIEVEDDGSKREVSIVTFPDETEITEKQRQNILLHGDEIIQFIHDIKAAAHIEAEKGAYVPGMKLVAKRANRVYKVEEKIVRRTLDRIGLHAADYMNPPTLKSPSQVETLFSAKGIALDKQRKFLDNFVEKPDNGTNLVPESRPGKPVQPAVETEFADLIESDDEDLLAF